MQKVSDSGTGNRVKNLNMENLIDISQHNKADVLRVLYDAAKPQGLGFLHFDPAPMTRDEADSLLKGGSNYFDYLKGRVMKVRICDDGELDPRLYDRDNGNGAAARAIEILKGQP